MRDLLDGAVERLLVGLRGLGEAADLADVLERRGADLVGRSRAARSCRADGCCGTCEPAYPSACDRRLRALSRRQAAARGPDGARPGGGDLHRRGRRRLRVAGHRRARARGARAGAGALRPARPRGRGRAELPPAPEGRAVRGRRARAVRRAAHRALRRRARGGRLRRGLRLHLRALRDHGAPGRGERPARRAAAARAPPRAARRGPGRGAVGDPRQGRRRLRAGRRGPRARHRGGREDRLQRRRRADRADLPAAPRGDRLLPRRAPAARRRSTGWSAAPTTSIGAGPAALLPRRRRPPQARRRGGRRPARPAGDDPAGQHGGRLRRAERDQRAPERDGQAADDRRDDLPAADVHHGLLRPELRLAGRPRRRRSGRSRSSGSGAWPSRSAVLYAWIRGHYDV